MVAGRLILRVISPRCGWVTRTSTGAGAAALGGGAAGRSHPQKRIIVMMAGILMALPRDKANANRGWRGRERLRRRRAKSEASPAWRKPGRRERRGRAARF